MVVKPLEQKDPPLPYEKRNVTLPKSSLKKGDPPQT
jgi:hypothetical protein